MKPTSLATKVVALLATGLFATLGCKTHHSDTWPCGQPQLTGATYVGYGGVGWGGYIVDPYYEGAGYAPGDGGWFSPGDDYSSGSSEPPDGWDSDDGDSFPGADDPASDIPGGTGDDTTGDDTGSAGDTSGDTGGTGADTTSLKPKIYSGTNPELPDANGCYSCLVGCRIGTGADGGRQAIGGSNYDYQSACRSAVHRVEAWAHNEMYAPIADCQVLIAAPTSDADAGADADTRTSADASIGENDASTTTPDVDAGAPDAPQ